MGRNFISSGFSTLILCIALPSSSFNIYQNAKATERTVRNELPGVILPNQLAPAPPESLFVLSTTVTAFKNLPHRKVVFKFVNVREDNMTLHGWRAWGATGRKFKTDPPVIKLDPTTEKELEYSADMYFGDIVLTKRQLRHIRHKIDQNISAAFVLFIPLKVEGTHIGYEIRLSNKPIKSVTLDVGTDEYANPSPPRNFRNDPDGSR